MKSQSRIDEALAHLGRGEITAAIEAFRTALAVDPDRADAWNNLGVLLKDRAPVSERIVCYQRAVTLQPQSPQFQTNLASALLLAGRFEDARMHSQLAVERDPRSAAAWFNLGHASHNLQLFDAAREAFTKTVDLDPRNVEAWLSLGTAHLALSSYERARNSFNQAEILAPDSALAKMWAVRGRMEVADWSRFAEDSASSERSARSGLAVLHPFSLLANPRLTGGDHLKAAAAYAAAEFASEFASPSPRRVRTPRQQPRVGYLAADLRDHVIGRLMAPVLQESAHRQHEVFIFDAWGGPNPLKAALQPHVTAWREVGGLSTADIANLIAEDEIDILVDLAGFTGLGRTGALALRPAPVQVNFLGYPGTLGDARLADYLICDPVTVPAAFGAHFAEKLAWLSAGVIPPAISTHSSATASRRASGLPRDAIVLAALHSAPKLNPDIFSGWMSILQKVPNAVLWLLSRSDDMEERLREEARKLGIEAGRLVFFRAMPYPQYMATLASADLFLDSQPYGAGGTAADALAVGLPLVTELGGTFAGRMAAASCVAAEVPECVASSRTQYMSRALELCRDHDLRRDLRTRLLAFATNANRRVSAFAAELDALFALMWQRYLAKAAPANIGPVSAEGIFHQALSLWRAGEKVDAISFLRHACALGPHNAAYPANLASALTEMGDFPAASQAAMDALRIDPERAESWHGFGNIHAKQSRWTEAAQAYERAAQLKPELPNCDQIVAQAWAMAGEPAKALHWYARVASGALGREDPEVMTAVAGLLARSNKIDEPLTLYAAVAQALPENAAAQSNLGIAYQAMGRHTEAIECYQRALALSPEIAGTWTNLIVSLNYSAEHGPLAVKSAAEAFNRNVAAPLFDGRSHPNNRDEQRPLRVGYVSPDFRRHAVAYFALPLIEGHTRQVEVTCYHSHAQFDDWTDRFRKASTTWVDCHGWTDEALAEKIRADRIDVLVDLAGHTENNRLLAFARKPAPVQVTWLGYVTTTGVSAIDWRMTYPDADPDGVDADYSEKLWRLDSGMWGYRPLDGMPTVAPAPHLRKGHVTFGHFNRFTKVSQQALACWADILTQVPGSRLVVSLPPGQTRQQVARFFEERGVAASRIDACDKMPHPDFWALHHEVDIALDPFPFNGGTTSYETLWLGVPLVTCTGGPGSFAPRFSSRMGAALLKALDLPELVGTAPDDYVCIAVALAQDSGRMCRLRSELRPRMAASQLLDEPLHARGVEAAYRAMWRQWCANPR
ncbi:MAG: tetratricopeptide repeat protein [Burkholderiales bacterium]|nr:tetratricopeptide repeat protein [Burkholderiales bacterium]